MPDKAAKEILEFALAHYGAAGAVVAMVVLLAIIVSLQTLSFSRAVRTASTTETKLLASMDVMLTGFQANAADHGRVFELWGHQAEAMKNLVMETRALRESAIKHDSLQSERLAVVLERLAGTGGGRRGWEQTRAEDAAKDDPEKRAKGC